MLPALLVFVVVTGLCIGVYFAVTAVPRMLAAHRMEQRLRELTVPAPPGEAAALVAGQPRGPLPMVDRLIGGTGAGTSLGQLIEQSGVQTSVGAVVLLSAAAAVAAGVVASWVVRHPAVIVAGVLVGGVLPVAWLKYRRAARLRRFEEQFPEALDLMSRAIRSGHAFQSSMGMVADELPAPVGAEFRRSFDQQNFGLPLREALNGLAERVPLLDVKFFVTAVTIQRETGGNLAEILDNLAHVVRERFKILRQVRVHTAHGRFTGYVLLALPPALAVVLRFINPEHMELLFQERMGHLMLMGAIVMQIIGYVWIRRVIRIEV
jgi:tight adherence protein B